MLFRKTIYIYTITWETDFGEQLVTRGNEPIPTSLPNGERPSTAQQNSNDAHDNEADYIITRDETNYTDRTEYSRNERLIDDATKRNEASEATRNEESDWLNPLFTQKIRKNFVESGSKTEKR